MRSIQIHLLRLSILDKHIAELTVRETLEFGAKCEGEGFAGNLRELSRLEKENHIRPSPEIDAFSRAASHVQGDVFSGLAPSITLFAIGLSEIAAFSLAIHYPTLAAAPHFLVNGYKNLLSLAVATKYSFRQAEKVKEFLKIIDRKVSSEE